MDISKIVEFIKQNRKPDTTFLVAIDGRSGSGKSSLADRFKESLSLVTVIHLDTFGMYEGQISSDRVIKEVLLPLKNNQKAEYKGYEKGYEKEQYTAEPGNVVILEGIFALNYNLEPFYDCKIWVDCPPEVGFKRGIARDKNLNGIDNSEKWLNYWMPKEEEYIKTQKPQEKADFVIDGTAYLAN